jgi:hypothetical protein
MWLKKKFPSSKCILVEPELINLQAGRLNFQLNGYTGEFINEMVSKNHFQIDRFLIERGIHKLDILHSDIQGFEMEMLLGAKNSLQKKIIDYAFISTHSQKLHHEVENYLDDLGYRVEISSDVDFDTTSYDGLIFASSPNKKAVFKKFHPLGREEITNSPTNSILDYLHSLKKTGLLARARTALSKMIVNG